MFNNLSDPQGMQLNRRRLFLRGISLAVIAVLTGLMGARTWARNPDWSDNYALAISTARDNLESGKACSWAGSVLIVNENPAVADFGRAMIERAIEKSPDYASARWELAKYYGLHGMLAESLIYLAQAAELDPGKHQTRSAVESVVEDLRRGNPLVYMPVLEARQRANPNDPSVHLALALAHHAQKNWDEAEAQAHQALDLHRQQYGDGFEQFHEAGAALAAIKYDRGDLNGAIDTYRKYLAWMQLSVDGHCAIAKMLLDQDYQKRPLALDEAAFHLRVANMIDPRNATGRVLRGRLNRIWKSIETGNEVRSSAAVTVSAVPGEKYVDSSVSMPAAPEKRVQP